MRRAVLITATLLLLTACTPASSPPQATSRAATPPRSGGADVVQVADAAALEQALAAAKPGTIIELSPGRYQRDKGHRWVAGADGTVEQPITLRGPREAVLVSDGIRGDYGLHITGDHWIIDGISVAEATKGIVLDGSVGTQLINLDVGTTGEEGIHFRACSSDGVLRGSVVHDTGLKKPQFGEGVYVGSASSNWDKYACDGAEDNTERVAITDNTFRTIAAEGADLKEGTDSGTLIGNTFEATGTSGENSADSAIDVKGNGWRIERNTIGPPSGKNLDAVQSHQVKAGWGTNNVIAENTIQGAWPGFGIGLYPALANRVACSNRAPAAAHGLVGDGSQPAECS